MQEEENQQLNNNGQNQNQRQKKNEDELYEQRELSTYESILNCCGDVSGFLRAWCPCICFCCSNPFKEIPQSFVGIVEKFGKYNRIINPGLNQINPCTDEVKLVDLRTRVIDMERQVIITKDNVSVNIDTCMYFRIIEPVRAFYRVQNLTQSVKEITAASLRQVCGENALQELLESREKIQDAIEQSLDKATDGWGIFVDEVFIIDMQINAEIQSQLAATAKNQRLAQAKVISAQADTEAAKLMREAADFLDNKAAMQIRFLETLQMISKGPNQKILFLPLSPDATAGSS